MKSSNIPNSIIAKYSRILTGIVFTATSVLPLTTSAIAVAPTNPVLTVTVGTRTTIVPASSEVVYRITVKNTTNIIAYKVKVTDVLPTGFAYARHLTTLQKGDVKFGSSATNFLDAAYTTKPAAGANTLVWDNITIPANGSIEFIFTATASATGSTTASSMQSLKVDYYNSAASTSMLTKTSPVSTETGDDVTVKSIPPTPSLTVAPSGSPIYESPICAQPGAQGLGVDITGIVNTYFKPAMQSVAAGASSISIASDAAIGATQDIKPGDLVLIVQMQDASINTTNSGAYGSGDTANQGSGQISMGSSGLYEYAIANSTVLAASGSVVKTLTLKKPLINTYTSANKTTTSGQKRFQVVRVPQYASVKVNGTMFAQPWDGNVGGILAVDAFGTFDLNGQRLSVNEAGFRGGFGPQNMEGKPHEGFVSPTTTFFETRDRTYGDKAPQTTYGFGSGKGEGVAGTPRFLAKKVLSGVDTSTKSPIWTGQFIDNGVDGYPGGDTGRGAPGNAGGGGNFHNSGGGGGGNGGNGGQGSLGMTYAMDNSVTKDAGGRPGSSSLTNTPTPMKVFMGGGGGGGEANDQPQGVPGGAGGGIVMLRAGTIVNTGTTAGIIRANGTNGDRGAYGANPDGAGGGGAGGTVLIQSRNPTSVSINIEAKGGSGGSTERDSFYDYGGSPITNLAAQISGGDSYSPDGYPYQLVGKTPHGPGGGGAGGIILYNVTSTATINPVVSGGDSGLTDDPSPLPAFSTLGAKARNSNGATAGSSGKIVRFSSSDDRFADLNAQTACSPSNLAMVVSTSNPTAAPGDIVNYKMKVTNPVGSGGATAVSFANQLPAGFTYTSTPATGGIILTGGATRPTDTVVNPTAGATRPSWGKFVIPSGGTVEINFKATIAANVQNGLYHDKAYSTYPNPLRISDTAADATTTNSYGEKPNETGGDITVKRNSVPMVWNVSPTIRIVRR